jgi:hypothetical protein
MLSTSTSWSNDILLWNQKMSLSFCHLILLHTPTANRSLRYTRVRVPAAHTDWWYPGHSRKFKSSCFSSLGVRLSPSCNTLFPTTMPSATSVSLPGWLSLRETSLAASPINPQQQLITPITFCRENRMTTSCLFDWSVICTKPPYVIIGTRTMRRSRACQKNSVDF